MVEKRELLTRICPVCGKEAKVLYSGVCEECYRASRRLLALPEVVEVTMCSVCRSYKQGGRWVRPLTDDPLREAVRDSVIRASKHRWKIHSIDVLNVEAGRATVKVTGKLAEDLAPSEEIYEVPLRLRWTLCTECIMAKSKREVARVQVRAKGRPLRSGEIELIKRIVQHSLSQRWRGEADLIDVVEGEGGVDFVFSSLDSARFATAALKRKLFVTILETRKSVGVASGKRIARHTLRVLLPEFSTGDVIELDDQLYYITQVTNTVVKALNLSTYAPCSLGSLRALVERGRVVRRREELEPAVVASLTSQAVDVVFLRTQKVATIFPEKPLEWVRGGEPVLVASVKGRLYLLPPVPTGSRHTRS